MNFLKKNFSFIALIVSLFLMVYIFYKSEIYNDGNKRDYYQIYYILTSIFFIFSIITFFTNAKIKEYLIIISMSLFFSFYLFEFYFFIKKDPKEKIYETKTGIEWDRRSTFEIYEDLKKISKEFVPAVTPSNYSNVKQGFFPLSGISKSKTIFCNENGYYSIYQSDRYGFNNPDTEWDKKEIEFLLVGDSLTHGACVNRPHDIGSVLRILSNKSVLNLGQGSTGPLTQYAILREYLNPNVKKVLWLYFEGNDLDDLEYEKKNDVLVKYLIDLKFNQNLKYKQNKIDELALSLVQELAKKKRLEEKKKIFTYNFLQFIKLYHTRTSIFTILRLKKISIPSPSGEFIKILELTKKLTEKNNTKLYFVYLPNYYRYKMINFDTHYESTKKIVNELNIPFIDINRKVFEKEQNPLKLFPFEENGHFNIEGFKKTSEVIYKYTKE